MKTYFGDTKGMSVGTGDLALVFEYPLSPSLLSPELMEWIKSSGIINRLGSIHCVSPDSSSKLKDLRKGWERVKVEMQYCNTKRALFMGNKIISLIVPKLSVSMKDAHGTIFRIEEGIEVVPTWIKFQGHQASWFNQDVKRFLALDRGEPLCYTELGKKWPEFMVIDLETTGLDTFSDKITTIGLQWSDTERAVIQDPSRFEMIIDILTKLANRGTQFVMHNAQFDLGFFPQSFRDAVYGKVHCTLINSRAKGELVNSLKHLGNLYTNRPGNYAWAESELDYDDPKYVCEDLEVTWQLAKRYEIFGR